jgi:multiple sugar transport system ATP-binding protein
LMDEPLSNLDAKLRVQMRAEISRLQRQLGVTTVYVTPDQVEAMTIGDRVAVMRKSRLQQVADPQTICDRPANLFVAGFIGSPPMNLLEGEVASGAAGQLQITIAGAPIDIDPAEQAAHPGLASRHGTIVLVGVRPERL